METHDKIEDAVIANAHFYASRLPPGCIRLLRVDPPGSQCSFKICSLDDAPEYHAISYTWRSAEILSRKSDGHKSDFPHDDDGLEPGNEEICYLEVDGQHHRVSKNIRDIVMRANDFDDANYLWIDSLCINQADHLERNAQVSMMGEIYNTAEDVAVWLGWDERNEMDTVIEICEIMQKEFLRQKEAGGPNFQVQKVTNLFERATKAKLGLANITAEGWIAFARFWDRRWFHRAWIVQEAALTANTRFFWHRDEISSDLLFDVSRFLMDAETGLNVDSAITVPTARQTRPRDWFVLRRRLGETLAKIKALNSIMQENPEEGLHNSFYLKLDTLGGPGVIDGQERTDCMRVWTHMLEIFRAFDATDPRDHVYATLGIIKATARNHGLDPPPIVVDYERPVAEVYADAARHIMEAGHCVNLLSLVQDPQHRNQPGLPSWVPDFSAGYNCPILMNKPTRSVVMPNLHKLGQSAEDAARNFRTDDNLKILKVKALLLDEVVAIGEDQHELTNGGVWEKTAQILLSHPNFAPESRRESRIESLWRTMVANTSYDGDNIASSDMACDFKAYMLASLVVVLQHEPEHLDRLPSLKLLTEEEKELRRLSNEPDPALVTFDEVLAKSAETDRLWAEIEAGGPIPETTPLASMAARFANAMEPMFFRRVILTRKGYLGIGPLSTQPGDLVWAMPQAPLPVILRESNRVPQNSVNDQNYKFSLLGEAYLHGDPDFFSTSQEWRWIDIV